MSDKTWYIAVGGQQQGPFSVAELEPRFNAGELDAKTFVFTQGMDGWKAAGERPEFADALAAKGAASASAPPLEPPPAAGGPPPGAAPPSQAHEIDYEIFGEEMQFVEVTLDPQEACIAEAGAFMYMDPGIQMDTIFGDGSANDGGFVGKLFGAAKRVVTGESLFMTAFGNTSSQRQIVAFASPYPGRVLAIDLRQHGKTLICQKDSFLAAARGISVGIAFQRKILTGLFGGEGFILQKLEGDGIAFIHAGGMVVEKTLAPGERMRLDTGCLVALEEEVSYEIERIKGVKSMIFGGEGLFFAKLTGPGKVWIQSLPFSRLAGRIHAAAPQTGGARRGEGSVLDAVGGLGNLLDGD